MDFYSRIQFGGSLTWEKDSKVASSFWSETDFVGLYPKGFETSQSLVSLCGICCTSWVTVTIHLKKKWCFFCRLCSNAYLLANTTTCMENETKICCKQSTIALLGQWLRWLFFFSFEVTLAVGFTRLVSYATHVISTIRSKKGARFVQPVANEVSYNFYTPVFLKDPELHHEELYLYFIGVYWGMSRNQIPRLHRLQMSLRWKPWFQMRSLSSVHRPRQQMWIE